MKSELKAMRHNMQSPADIKLGCFFEQAVKSPRKSKFIQPIENSKQQAYAGLFMMGVFGILLSGMLSALNGTWFYLIVALGSAALTVVSAFLSDKYTVGMSEDQGNSAERYTIWPLNFVIPAFMFAPIIWLAYLFMYGVFRLFLFGLHVFKITLPWL